MKKTIKKRAFVSAIAMLIVSAIVLTSSTFAWFSMSKKASVDAMDLTVSSPEGIQISANASAWTASLSIDEIFDTDDTTTSRYDAYEGNANLYPTDLVPASSAFLNANTDTGFPNFFKATLDDNGNANVTKIAETAGNDDNAGIIAFDLFFKVANQTTVYFGTSQFTDSANTDVLTALRVAFIPLGNAAIGTPASTVTGLKNFVAQSASNVIYEVDTLNRSADAIANGQSDNIALTTKPLNGTVTSVATDKGIITSGSVAGDLRGTFVKSNATDSTKSFVLNAGITKMRVYIWVEGQDVDCLNSIAGAAFNVALNFTID
ncbi:MAG: hypothetical protein ACI4XH_01930 [Acutalibacteraceae bacterium]